MDRFNNSLYELCRQKIDSRETKIKIDEYISFLTFNYLIIFV